MFEMPMVATNKKRKRGRPKSVENREQSTLILPASARAALKRFQKKHLHLSEAEASRQIILQRLKQEGFLSD